MADSQITDKIIQKWNSIIYLSDKGGKKINDACIRKLINNLARGYYIEYTRIKKSVNRNCINSEDFDNLTNKEKNIYYGKAIHIQNKLATVNLLIKKYDKYCRTPIITEEEVSIMAQMDHERWFREMKANNWSYGEVKNEKTKTHPDLVPYQELPIEKKIFDREIIYSIPYLLKIEGYDIIRSEEIEEISYELNENLARIIHNKYLETIKHNWLDSKLIKRTLLIGCFRVV